MPHRNKIRSPEESTMEDRVIDLETRLAFQEYTLQQLNDIIVGMRDQLDRLERRLQFAEERLVEADPNILNEPQDETPPHY